MKNKVFDGKVNGEPSRRCLGGDRLLLVDKIKIFLDSIVGKKPDLFYWCSKNE